MTEIARPATSGRRVVMIVGSGRSGTSVMACTLQQLGMRVPQPEVPADETNPKGFGESQWLVDFHDRLLQRANVTVSDARPRAWFSTSKQSTHERFRRQASMWLERQFEEADEVVLKDRGWCGSWACGRALRCTSASLRSSSACCGRRPR